jgi:hypothetical protein
LQTQCSFSQRMGSALGTTTLLQLQQRNSRSCFPSSTNCSRSTAAIRKPRQTPRHTGRRMSPLWRGGNGPHRQRLTGAAFVGAATAITLMQLLSVGQYGNPRGGRLVVHTLKQCTRENIAGRRMNGVNPADANLEEICARLCHLAAAASWRTYV